MESTVAEHRRTTSPRPAWRQRLVDAETGLRVGLRADSSLIICFVCGGILLVTALVIGLTRVEWALFVLALGGAVSAEFFHQVLKQLWRADEFRALPLEHILRLGTTAALCAQLTALLVTALLFWNRFAQLFG